MFIMFLLGIMLVTLTREDMMVRALMFCMLVMLTSTKDVYYGDTCNYCDCTQKICMHVNMVYT